MGFVWVFFSEELEEELITWFQFPQSGQRDGSCPSQAPTLAEGHSNCSQSPLGPALLCFPRENGASWNVPPLMPSSRPSQSGLQTTAALTHFLSSLLSLLLWLNRQPTRSSGPGAPLSCSGGWNSRGATAGILF